MEAIRVRSLSSSYLPAMDGLRAVAALSVVMFHESFFPFGWAGVWIFFVISGFVITRMLNTAQWTLSRRNYWDFTSRRISRIWPLYFLYLFVVIILSISFGVTEFPTNLQIISLLTFTYDFYAMYSQGTPTVAHLWSISVEQQFYLFFPFLFALMARVDKRLILLTMFGVAVMARLVLALGLISQGADGSDLGGPIYHFSLGHFDAFAVGAMAALYPDELILMRRRLALWTFVMVGFALAFVAVRLHGGHLHPVSVRALIDATKPYFGEPPYADGAAIWCYLLVLAISASLLAFAVGPTNAVQDLLACKPLVWVGKVSFGVYMWQGIVAPIFYGAVGAGRDAGMGARLVACACYLAVLVGTASASYLLFERRFHHRGGFKVLAEPAASPATS